MLLDNIIHFMTKVIDEVLATGFGPAMVITLLAMTLYKSFVLLIMDNSFFRKERSELQKNVRIFRDILIILDNLIGAILSMATVVVLLMIWDKTITSEAWIDVIFGITCAFLVVGLSFMSYVFLGNPLLFFAIRFGNDVKDYNDIKLWKKEKR